MLAETYRHRALLWNFVRRDLKGRYAGSVMGFYWNIINPLILISVYTFVFSYVMKVKLPPNRGTDVFAIYMFCGLLPWIAFSEAITRNATIVLDNASLVRKVNFPTEILLVYVVVSSFIHELLALVVMLVFLVAFGSLPGPKALLLPIFFVAQLMLTLGLSFIVSSLNVYFRDVAHLLAAVMMVWFFGTPIIYPLELVPEAVRGLMGINPMTQLVEIYRGLILADHFHTIKGMVYFLGISLAVFYVGSRFFSKTKKEFPDLI